MTDSPYPPPPESAPDPWPVPEVDELDLAASAWLDEAGSGGRAPEPGVPAGGPARGPGEVEARAAQLRPAVEALAESIQQPDTRIRDEQLRRALAARRLADDPSTDPAGTLVGGGYPSGRLVAGARRGLAVAAAIGLLLVGALAVAHLASSHGPGAHTASVAGAAASTTQAAADPDAALPQAGVQGSASLDQLQDLGSFADADALVARVGQHQGNGRFKGLFGPATTAAGPEAQASAAATAGLAERSETCEAAVRAARHDLGPIDQVARASLAGQAVEVLLFGAGPAPTEVARVVAVRPADCQVVVDRTA
jgi:hypothetical protein